jgi:hypothetical protein
LFDGFPHPINSDFDFVGHFFQESQRFLARHGAMIGRVVNAHHDIGNAGLDDRIDQRHSRASIKLGGSPTYRRQQRSLAGLPCFPW